MKREFEIIIELNTASQAEAKQIIKAAFKNIVSIKCLEKRRTSRQNRSCHLWFSMLADELNAKHFDMRALIRKDIEMPWTAYAIKEYLFRPLLREMFGKKSTTQITTNEMNDIFDIITKVIAERTNGECEYVPFPSMEELMISDYQIKS